MCIRDSITVHHHYSVLIIFTVSGESKLEHTGMPYINDNIIIAGDVIIVVVDELMSISPLEWSFRAPMTLIQTASYGRVQNLEPAGELTALSRSHS